MDTEYDVIKEEPLISFVLTDGRTISFHVHKECTVVVDFHSYGELVYVVRELGATWPEATFRASQVVGWYWGKSPNPD